VTGGSRHRLFAESEIGEMLCRIINPHVPANTGNQGGI